MVKFLSEVRGDHKVVLSAVGQPKTHLAFCSLTWFPLQETVHVFFALPALHSRHGVTTFQKFKGSFEDLICSYSALFQEVVWIVVPFVNGKSGVEMMYHKLKGTHPSVSALVRCLVQLKKNVASNKSHVRGGCEYECGSRRPGCQDSGNTTCQDSGNTTCQDSGPTQTSNEIHSRDGSKNTSDPGARTSTGCRVSPSTSSNTSATIDISINTNHNNNIIINNNNNTSAQEGGVWYRMDDRVPNPAVVNRGPPTCAAQ